MGGHFQVQRNYVGVASGVGWLFYTLGPLQGAGWLCAVGLAYYGKFSAYGAWSLSLVSTSEGSEANHTSGVNLLALGGEGGLGLGDWRPYYGNVSLSGGALGVYPMWVGLQTGSHWVSVAVRGLNATNPTWSWAWAAVLAKSFVNGLVGVAVSAAAMPSGGRR